MMKKGRVGDDDDKERGKNGEERLSLFNFLLLKYINK